MSNIEGFASRAGAEAQVTKWRFKGMDKREMAEERYWIDRKPLRLANPACAGKDPNLWHRRTRSAYEIELERNAEALKICDSCEDRISCLEYALSNSEDCGIWGGTMSEERRGVDASSAEWLIATVDRRRDEILSRPERVD